jgi:hypothetical protein
MGAGVNVVPFSKSLNREIPTAGRDRCNLDGRHDQPEALNRQGLVEEREIGVAYIEELERRVIAPTGNLVGPLGDCPTDRAGPGAADDDGDSERWNYSVPTRIVGHLSSMLLPRWARLSLRPITASYLAIL